MSDIAIRVENLGKRYRIGARLKQATTLRETLQNLTSPFGYLLGTLRGPSEDEILWALRDVSFEVKHGEVLGIIGRNGAGKSTLLKILSRITEPTTGRAEVYGRIASLLEVGTGFHPELTGRENTYMNGAILGMHRAEIDRKFDEIVAFSGVEKFIDTPVKRYSSGMRVRLAFAVAAHLEPEILLVDEVLAVGDAHFQEKCLGKMEDVSQTGRTVLFVSHNMPSITRLCDRAILLDSGKLLEDGPSNGVVATYLRSGLGISAKREWPNPEEAPGNDWVRMRSVRIVNTARQTSETVDVRDPVGIEIVFDILEQQSNFVPWVALYNEQGAHVFSAFDTDPAWREPRKPGPYTSVAWIPGDLLNEGAITVSVTLSTFVPGKNIRQAQSIHAVAFQVIDPGEGDTARGDYPGIWTSPVRPLLNWETVTESV